MERQPGTDKIEYGQLGAELLAAGLINREANRKAKVALLRCGGCPKPLANQMPALGDGDTCEEAYQDGERVCLEFFRCATAERRSCMDNTGF
jgi:hypothetical protein